MNGFLTLDQSYGKKLMNIFNYLEAEFEAISDKLKGAGTIPETVDTSKVVFELPRDATHGDIACNAAMVLAKQAQMKPRKLAELLAGRLAGCDGVTRVDIAGPGFINISVEPRLWSTELRSILLPARAMAAMTEAPANQ